MSDLILVSAAAETMGVSYRSAKRSLKNAKIPFKRIGRSPAIAQADFLVFQVGRLSYKGRGPLPPLMVQTKIEQKPAPADWAALSEKIEDLAREANVSPYGFMVWLCETCHLHDFTMNNSDARSDLETRTALEASCDDQSNNID